MPVTEPVSWVFAGLALCAYAPVTVGMLLVRRQDRPHAWPLGALCWPLLAVVGLLALLVCTLPLPRLRR